MYQLLLIFHILVAIAMVGLVLLQHGKGADIGAAFGSGASNTVFGSQGTGSFLFKLTGGLVLTFFASSVWLSAMVSHQYHVSMAIPTEEVQMPASDSLPIPLPDRS